MDIDFLYSDIAWMNGYLWNAIYRVALIYVCYWSDSWTAFSPFTVSRCGNLAAFFRSKMLRVSFNSDTNMVCMFDRTSEILKQLKVLFGSVTAIPAQVFLTGYLISWTCYFHNNCSSSFSTHNNPHDFDISHLCGLVRWFLILFIRLMSGVKIHL